MVFPGQLDEVAGVPEKFEAQRAIERDRPLDVANDDLADEVLGGLDVWTIGSGHLRHGISPRGPAVASSAERRKPTRPAKATEGMAAPHLGQGP